MNHKYVLFSILTIATLMFAACAAKTPVAPQPPTDDTMVPDDTTTEEAPPAEDEQPEPIVEENTDTFSGDEFYVTVFTRQLEHQDIKGIKMKVDDARETEGMKVVSLSYTKPTGTTPTLRGQIFSIAGALIASVDSGWDIDELDVTAKSSEGDISWTYKKAALDDYKEGLITDEGLTESAMMTIREV
ncbi:MAG: hypothetical protein ABIH41_05875 [Nanoarchaeota archaeon]